MRRTNFAILGVWQFDFISMYIYLTLCSALWWLPLCVFAVFVLGSSSRGVQACWMPCNDLCSTQIWQQLPPWFEPGSDCRLSMCRSSWNNWTHFCFSLSAKWHKPPAPSLNVSDFITNGNHSDSHMAKNFKHMCRQQSCEKRPPVFLSQILSFTKHFLKDSRWKKGNMNAPPLLSQFVPLFHFTPNKMSD